MAEVTVAVLVTPPVRVGGVVTVICRVVVFDVVAGSVPASTQLTVVVPEQVQPSVEFALPAT